MPGSPIRAVIDTNILFEGLTRKGSAAGFVVEAWLAGIFRACVSNSLAYEYFDAMSRKLAPKRWRRIQPVLGSLLKRALYVPIYYSWRPMSPDPGDEHIVDCAMNAGAWVVTENIRDFRLARSELGLPILTAVEFLKHLANGQDLVSNQEGENR